MSASGLEAFHRRLDGIQTNPYPIYRRYRERDPIHLGVANHRHFPNNWFLFRHADVDFVLKDKRFARDWHAIVEEPVTRPHIPPGSIADLVGMVERWMLFVDPPDHTRLRGRVSHAFRPKTSERLAPYVENTARSLLEAAGEHFDGMRDFALPLTVAAIAELLGVPEDSRHLMGRTIARLRPVFAGDTSPTALLPAADAAADLSARFAELLAARLDEPRDDLMSELAPGAGERDSPEWQETIATAVFLLGAGFVTTVHGIGNAVHALLGRPEQMEVLRAEPPRTRPAVDELLRFESPVQRVARFPVEDVEVSGVLLERGSMVTPVIGAANRDPLAFEDPEELDVSRDARRHLAFGGGTHSCLGAPLARLEIRIALEVLLQEMPTLSRDDAGGEPVWSEGLARGLDSLPLRR